jgi:hypothetical protein
MAYSALVEMWTKDFRNIGERFVPPRIVRYTGAARTTCGYIGPSNAQYCPNNNTILYDEVFVAGMAKVASSALGTDGDMASIGVIENRPYLEQLARERLLDKPAPDFALPIVAGTYPATRAERDRSLERRYRRSVFGMSPAGDPTPELTGNVRYDAMVQARLARQSHGTRNSARNFREGSSAARAPAARNFDSTAFELQQKRAADLAPAAL